MTTYEHTSTGSQTYTQAREEIKQKIIPAGTTLYMGTRDPHLNEAFDMPHTPFVLTDSYDVAKYRAHEPQPGVVGIPRIVIYETTVPLALVTSDEGYMGLCDAFGYVTAISDLYSAIKQDGYSGWYYNGQITLVSSYGLEYVNTYCLLLPVHETVIQEALDLYTEIVTIRKNWENTMKKNDQTALDALAALTTIREKLRLFTDILIDQDQEVL